MFKQTPFEKIDIPSLTNFASSIGVHSDSINKALKTIGATASSVKASLEEMITSRIEALDTQTKMTQQIINTAAQTGRIGDIFNTFKENTLNSGAVYDSLSNSLLKMRLNFSNLSSETGVSLETLASLYTSINKLPQSFDSSGKATKNLSDNLSESNKTMEYMTRLSSMTGEGLDKLYTKAGDSMKYYNITLDQSLTLLSHEVEVANKLHVSLDLVHSYMMSVAQETGTLGDNSRSSAEIFEMFQGRLSQVGITADKSKEIIQGFTKSIADLDVTHRAFLSQQAGGPGGLMGSYQVQDMIAKGDLKGVVDMAEKALRKEMGGRIVSREEASQSETAAAQYTKQTMMLQQGPLGGLIKDEASAQAFLKGMTKDSKDANGEFLNGLLSDQKVRSNIDTTAAGIQQKTNTLMVDLNNSINNWIASIENAQAKTANDLINPTYNKGRLKYDPEKDSSSIERMAGAAAQKFTMIGGTIGNNAVEIIKHDAKKLTEILPGIIQGLISEAKEILLGQNNPTLKKYYDDSISNKYTSEPGGLSADQTAVAKKLKELAIKTREKEDALSNAQHHVDNHPTYNYPTYNQPASPGKSQGIFKGAPHAQEMSAHDTTDGTAINFSGKVQTLVLQLKQVCPYCHIERSISTHAAAAPTNVK